jgi:hypothetical protein
MQGVWGRCNLPHKYSFFRSLWAVLPPTTSGREILGKLLVNNTATTAGIDDDCGAYGSGSVAEKQCYDPSGSC